MGGKYKWGRVVRKRRTIYSLIFNTEFSHGSQIMTREKEETEKEN
jgi:hypothetical protein